jgi:hypothetical protein
MKCWTDLWVLAVLASGSALAGCTVEDGDQGLPGAPGNTIIATPTTPNAIQEGQDLPGVVLAVTALGGASGPGGAFQAGDRISVTFTLKKRNGQNLLASELDSSGIYVSGPSFNYQRVIPRLSDFHKSVVTNADGSYTYTFPSVIPSVYEAPYNDSTDAGFSQGELAGQALLDGTYTIGIHAYRNYYTPTASFRDVANVEKDFLFGAATTLQPREVVKNANCNACHSTLQAHGGSRRDVKLCLLCHTSGGEDEEHTASIDFRVMIHKIHNAANLPSVLGVTTDVAGARDYTATPKPYEIAGADFSKIIFPVWPSMSKSMPADQGYSQLSTDARAKEDAILKGAIDCAKCHGDPDGSGSGTAPAQGNLCYSQPSRRACGSCHDDIVWANPYVANGQTMPAQGNDSACALCHVPSGTTFGNTEVHVHPINNPAFNPGLKFAVTQADRILPAGTVGTGNFTADDRLRLTFTVKDEATTPANVPVSSLDSCTMVLVGPTENRQYPLPNVSISPFDYSGRLVSTSTTGKGAMSKVVGATETEVVTVLFSSATTFNVTGSASGALGTGLLLPAASTNPSKSSLSGVIIAGDQPVGDYTVTFTGAQAFSVTGPGGALGSGMLPASTSSSLRFITSDGRMQFTLAVDTAAFATGNVINLHVYQAGAANPFRFAIVRGSTNFANNDRFYYEVVDEATTTYAYNIPMDIGLEFLGQGDGIVTEFTAGNLPVYAGRQSVWEVTATTAATAAAAAIPSQWALTIDMLTGSGIASTDTYLLLDKLVAATRECVAISKIETLASGNDQVWLKNPIRYKRTILPTVDRVTDKANMPLRLEGVNYTLNSTTGMVTFTAAPPATSSIIMSYRTDGRFGWRRKTGDAPQTVYSPPTGDGPDYDQSWGEWRGLSYVDGTYSVAVWGYKQRIFGRYDEYQYYRSAANAAMKDILYGTASEIQPHGLISSQTNCNSCHNSVLFHGGGRRGADACLFCHGEAGAQMTSPGPTIDFRTMLHKIHQGKELANALTYFSGDFAEVGFPTMPGGTKHCTSCHGSSNDAWKEPARRAHPSQTVPTRGWRAVCGSCHDSDSAGAHFNLMTDSYGTEACEACHGPGSEQSVELKHKNR